MSINAYDFNSDEIREATQDDFDDLQIALNRLGAKDTIIKFVSNLDSLKDQDLIKELTALLTPYLHSDLEFTGYSSFSKTWIKNNPDKVKKIDEWRKANPNSVAN